MKGDIGKGVAAGFVATLALSALMILKDLLGLFPKVDLIALLSGFIHAPAAVGWVVHLFIGSVIWGGLFGLLALKIPGATAITKGVLFAVALWLVMQLIVLPLTPAGFFGIGFGFWAPVVNLALHVVYGAVLGSVYAMLKGHWHAKSPTDDARGALRYTHYTH
ncbi:DUF6789 family protein [Caulobacter sp. 17J80-11]|uniref:DUF6789 family protein n=1 Tax=Caulobacter sp. 17J80-11 TaxID=2763502 RepID=UPI0016534AAE|nr:DUF6789 family protein [Caulobacter sp. 17J80-11]MBC6982296.1 hypothetical protein [Caulobacter sp. 17J80-11]